MSYDENEAYSIGLARKVKLGINEIKDIDSALDALAGNVAYSGNIVLGNSGFVERSNRCANAYYVK